MRRCRSPALWLNYEPLRDGWRSAASAAYRFSTTRRLRRAGPEHSVLEFGSGMRDACEYIATHFGSRVTGLEIGTEQIDAPANVTATPVHATTTSSRLTFWIGSRRNVMTRFTSSRCCRLFTIAALLEKIHGWLRPGGALTMSDIVAGPGLSDADREFLWVEDGVVHNLPTQEERLALIRDVGFDELDVLDTTHMGITQNERILEESYRHKEAIVDGVGLTAG